MEGRDEILDHLFQAARNEPVGSSAQDISNLLASSGSIAGGAATSGGASWWGSSAYLGAKIVGGIVVLGGLGILFGVMAGDSPSATLAPVALVAEAEPTQQSPENLPEVIAVDEVTEAPAEVIPVEAVTTKEAVIELDASNEIVVPENAGPTTPDPVTSANDLTAVAPDPIREGHTVGGHEQETPASNFSNERNDEIELNNLYVSGEMPEEDPFSQTVDVEVVVETNTVAPIVARKSSQTLKRKSSEYDLRVLLVRLSAQGVELQIEEISRRGKKIKSMTWKMAIKVGHVMETCSYTATDFSEIQFDVQLDAAGNAISIEIFIEGPDEQRVISCRAKG